MKRLYNPDLASRADRQLVDCQEIVLSYGGGAARRSFSVNYTFLKHLRTIAVPEQSPVWLFYVIFYFFINPLK